MPFSVIRKSARNGLIGIDEKEPGLLPALVLIVPALLQ